MRCLKIASLLQRRASGLSPAERLAVEDHLETCTRCQQEARDLEALARLVEASDVPLRPSQRQRAIEQALAAAAQVPAAVRPAPRSWGWSGPVLAGATLMALVSLRFVFDAPPVEPIAPERVLSQRSNEDTVKPPTVPRMTGQIEHAGGIVSRDESLPSRVALWTKKGARVRMDWAELALAPDTRFEWDAETNRLRLKTGAATLTLVADKATLPESPLQLVTDEFDIVIIGRQFTVEPDGIQITEGPAQILDNQGRVLSADLQTGQRWRPKKLLPASSETRRARPSPKPRKDWMEQLSKIRFKVAKQDVEGARKDLRAILSAPLTRQEEAEARTLLAECALVAGEPQKAVKLYTQIARRFPRLPAAETARFAAARIEADRGGARAKAMLEAYLRRHPNGRFRAEAQKRLDALPSSK